MNMKKALVFTAVTGCIIGACAITGYAIDIDSAKEQLNQLSGYDFMGFEYEKLLFELREAYAKGSVIKEIWFDIATTKEQIIQTMKCFEDNDLIYYSIGGVGALIKLKKIGVLLRLLR